ncbi:LysR family transcriptional regulator [Klebsiella quasipneumoniae]|nr:LysR family transcriptional regulator [Klebsiella quasipneumoniae]
MISEPVEALVNISGNEVKEVAVSNNIHMIRTLIKEQMGIGILCRLDILDEIESRPAGVCAAYRSAA